MADSVVALGYKKSLTMETPAATSRLPTPQDGGVRERGVDFTHGSDVTAATTHVTHLSDAQPGGDVTGSSHFRRAADVDASHGVTYSWSGLNVYAKPRGGLLGGKRRAPEAHILKDVSGLCRAGQLLAIMGASGAGKTTLLNVLTFRASSKLRIAGDIRLDGHPADPLTIAGVSAYVQQLDLFTGVFTVREQLNFCAQLRIGKGVPERERTERVEQVIKDLGLRKCADNLIGIPGRVKGISGGEKKRLAFACEVITNPMMLLCDEPTSGLDSFMAQNVMASMKRLAEQGRTVISTIHQPSSEVFAMFDRLLILAEGRVAFLGDVKEAHAFFERLEKPCPSNFNPGDHFIYTLAIRAGMEEKCREYVHSVCDEFKQSEGRSLRLAVEGCSKPPPDDAIASAALQAARRSKDPYRSTWVDQFAAMTRRCAYVVVRDPLVTFVKTMTTVFFALVFGSVYFDLNPDTDVGRRDIQSALFMFCTNMTFSMMFPVITLFSKDTPLFLREHWNGLYRTDVYFLTKTLVEIPIYVGLPCIFTAIIYYMAGLRPEAEYFFTAMGVLVLVSNVAVSFGLMISCTTKDYNTAIVLATPLLMPIFLFGGYYVQPGTIPIWLEWITYISWFYYGVEVLNINEFSGRELGCDVAAGVKTCVSGDDVLEASGFDASNKTADLCALVGLFIGYRLIAYLLLLRLTYKK